MSVIDKSSCKRIENKLIGKKEIASSKYRLHRADGYYYATLKHQESGRGILKRTSVADFDVISVDQRKWENLISMDELSQKEGKQWSLRDSTDYSKAHEGVLLIKMSEGGEPYSGQIRRFDINKKVFLGDMTEFSKSFENWLDGTSTVFHNAIGHNALSNGYAGVIEKRTGDGVITGKTENQKVDILYSANRNHVYLKCRINNGSYRVSGW